MARNIQTDAEVELEILRLTNNEDVHLAQKYHRLKSDKRRKYLSQLRWYEKVGKALKEQGITFENMEEMLFSDEPEEITEEGTT